MGGAISILCGDQREREKSFSGPLGEIQKQEESEGSRLGVYSLKVIATKAR